MTTFDVIWGAFMLEFDVKVVPEQVFDGNGLVTLTKPGISQIFF